MLRKEIHRVVPISSLHEQLTLFVDLLLEHRVDLDFAKRELEAQYIRRIMAQNNGHIGNSARALGVHRNTLTKRIRDLDIDVSRN